MKIIPIILAAGQGTRMRSSLPKMLHLLGGQPLVNYSVTLAQALSPQPPIVVVGHGEDAVRQKLGEVVHFAVQEQQLGTAHAVMAAEGLARGLADLVVVIFADMPLLKLETLQKVVAVQMQNKGPITMLSVELGDPHGFGRVIRGGDGTVQAIVEEAQATPEQLAIRELNASVYCFRSEWFWPALHNVKISPKGEYYLTDIVEIAVKEGLTVQAVCTEDPTEAVGINTRVHLAEAEAILRQRINTAWMQAGVTMIDPQHTYIEASVKIGQDTIIYPNTYLRGKTMVGNGCEIGPDTILADCSIGDRCTILASVLEGAVLEDHVGMGPFCHLRKGAYLCKDVHMGNFGEVKDSTLGPGTKMGHFSYIGNAKIGAEVNIGAGTITCNYDGQKKHPTEIGDHAFIGSDTMLVAPVKIGDDARTGAGAVVTHDVPPGEVVVGVPARPFKKSEEGQKDDSQH